MYRQLLVRPGLRGSLVVFFVAAFLLSVTSMAGTRESYAQATVVSPDQVSTPTPFAVLLPTVTPAYTDSGPYSDTHDGSNAIPGASYIVREGDTLWTAALEIGVDLAAMPCLVSPHFRANSPLVIGDRLEIPAGEIICHQVQTRDSISSIANDFGVDENIIWSDAWNGLERSRGGSGPLEAGRYVRIIVDKQARDSGSLLGYLLDRPINEPPMLAYAVGGPVRAHSSPPVPDDWPYGSGYFEWPTYGWITQGYLNSHRAVDIAAPPGTFVTAADRGVVVRAGWNSQGYGMFVVVDHNIDYVTLYSHLQDVLVEEGDVVALGQVIGTVGSTGNSTGPHLHFEIRDFGTRINPLEALLR